MTGSLEMFANSTVKSIQPKKSKNQVSEMFSYPCHFKAEINMPLRHYRRRNWIASPRQLANGRTSFLDMCKLRGTVKWIYHKIKIKQHKNLSRFG